MNYKFPVIVTLLAIASFLTYYFHAVLKIGIVFTHFFYIPIILGALWWRKKGMLVAVFLVALIFLSNLLIKKETPSYDDLLRSSMFIVISTFVVFLSEKIELKNQLLKESEEKSRLIVQSANDAIILTDQDNKIISWNNSAMTMFGYSEEEMIGKSFLKLLPERYNDTYRYGLEWMLSKNIFDVSGKSIEMHGVRKDGNEFGLEISAGELVTEKGIFHTCIIRDITERKRLEEEIIRVNMDMKMADQIKTQFLSVVSHELRTPITPMKAQLQMIIAGYFGELTEKQKKSLEMILRNTSRLDRMIGDVLDISKIESKVMRFNKDRANLNELVKNAVETMKPTADDKNIKISLKETNVPDIIMDTDRITQVVINLVNNAIKFTDTGGSINVEISSSDGNACVKVSDTGIGIKKEDQARLFTPFVQVDSTVSRKFEGTGLGLAICKGIIHSHEGKIWVESELGKGSTFRFNLPLSYENYS